MHQRPIGSKQSGGKDRYWDNVYCWVCVATLGCLCLSYEKPKL